MRERRTNSVYCGTAIAVRIPSTTMTIRSSMSVNPASRRAGAERGAKRCPGMDFSSRVAAMLRTGAGGNNREPIEGRPAGTGGGPSRARRKWPCRRGARPPCEGAPRLPPRASRTGAGEPEDVDELIAPIELLADALPPEARARLSPQQWRKRVLEAEAGLPATLERLRAFWTIVREPPATFRRDGAKVGRNDPCSCGSGRKFKQCHGRG